MPRQDWGFSVGPVRQAEFESAAQNAAQRVNVRGYGEQQLAAALLVATSLAGELHGGDEHLVQASFNGHANDEHPGDGSVHDQVQVSVTCACTVPNPAPPPAAAEPSQPATVAAEEPASTTSPTA